MSNKGVIEEKSKSPIQYTFDDGGYSPNEELKSKKATTEPKKRGRPKKNEVIIIILSSSKLFNTI